MSISIGQVLIIVSLFAFCLYLAYLNSSNIAFPILRTPKNIHPDLTVYIVYNAFIYLPRKNWATLIEQQLTNLVDNGLADRAERIYISLSMENTTSKHHVSTISNRIHSIFGNKASIEATIGNRFEYPGIRAVYDIAQARRQNTSVNNNNTIILYFHSKGMFNAGVNTKGESSTAPRSGMEKKLFRTVIDTWPKVLGAFSLSTPYIDRAGYAASPTGFLWYNFFWVRGSYAAQLAPPVVSPWRWYYESWISVTLNASSHNATSQSHSSPPNSSITLPILSMCQRRIPVGASFSAECAYPVTDLCPLGSNSCKTAPNGH